MKSFAHNVKVKVKYEVVVVSVGVWCGAERWGLLRLKYCCPPMQPYVGDARCVDPGTNITSTITLTCPVGMLYSMFLMFCTVLILDDKTNASIILLQRKTQPTTPHF